jgi:Septum formation
MAAAVGAAVLSWCTGCTSTVTGQGTASAEVVAAPPAKGSCWQLRTTDFGSALDQPARRACTQPHDTETIWVATDALDRTLPYPTEAQTEQSSGAVSKALDDACNWHAVSAYLGDEDGWYTAYVSWEARLPSRGQWAAGARWVRCDVVYGVDEPETSPGPLAGSLKGPDKVAFRACYDGSPTSNRVIACSRPHQAEIVTAGLDLGDTAFPSAQRTRQAMAQTFCGPALEESLGQGPRPADLQLDLYLETSDPSPGQFTASCVLVRVDGRESTTVALP